MAINTENGPITPRGILPGEIDPVGRMESSWMLL